MPRQFVPPQQREFSVRSGFFVVLPDPSIAQFLSPITAAGRAALDALVTQQAQVIAYIDGYKLLLIATSALFGLLVIFKKSGGMPGHAASIEG
jgi:hypothetical protein